MTLECPSCRGITEVSSELEQAILAKLKKPQDVYVLRCRCGLGDWILRSRRRLESSPVKVKMETAEKVLDRIEGELGRDFDRR